MRRTSCLTSLILLAALAGCSGGANQAGRTNEPAIVCGEQAAMAQSGKVGGGDIRITCSETTQQN